MRARDRFVEHLRRGPRHRSGAPGVPASFPHGDRARDEPGASRPPVASSAMISRSRHCVGCSKRCGHVEPSPDRVPAVFTDCARDPGPTDTSSLLCEVPAKQLVRGGTYRGGDSSPLRLQRRSVEKVRARRSLSARLHFQGDLASIVRFEGGRAEQWSAPCHARRAFAPGDSRPGRASSASELQRSRPTLRTAGTLLKRPTRCARPGHCLNDLRADSPGASSPRKASPISRPLRATTAPTIGEIFPVSPVQRRASFTARSISARSVSFPLGRAAFTFAMGRGYDPQGGQRLRSFEAFNHQSMHPSTAAFSTFASETQVHVRGRIAPSSSAFPQCPR